MPKISELPPVGGVNTVDTIPLVQAGTTAKATFAQLPVSTAVQAALDLKVNTSAVGTIASQNANGVAITGGSITGITDLAIADGGTGSSTAAGAFTNLKQEATDSTTGVVELATDAEYATGTDTSRVLTVASARAQNLVSGTAVSATGTSIDFTGIPSWVKRITVMVYGVAIAGTSPLVLQLGDSGGVETTGYLGATAGGPHGSTLIVQGYGVVTGFAMAVGDAAHVLHGSYVLTKMTGNTWTLLGSIGLSNVASGFVLGGTKTLSATLDRVRLTTNGGVNTFSAGTFNIMYE